MSRGTYPKVLLLASEGPMTMILPDWLTVEFGVQPILVHDPTGILEVLKSSRFDCVIIEMSQTFDLVDTIQIVRASCDDSVGIMAIASYSPGDEFRNRIAGMDVDLLVVPFRLQSVADAVNRAIVKTRTARSGCIGPQSSVSVTRSLR